MKILGEVLEIFSATKESSGLPRPKVETLNLITQLSHIKPNSF